MSRKKKLLAAAALLTPSPTRECYWLVHNPTRAAPSIRHTSADDATTEARRLAQKQPGETFYVLKVVYAYVAEIPAPAACVITAPTSDWP